VCQRLDVLLDVGLSCQRFSHFVECESHRSQLRRREFWKGNAAAFAHIVCVASETSHLLGNPHRHEQGEQNGRGDGNRSAPEDPGKRHVDKCGDVRRRFDYRQHAGDFAGHPYWCCHKQCGCGVRGFRIALDACAVLPIEREAGYTIDRFETLGNIVDDPGNFSVHADTPIKTLAEFVDYAKANPGQLNYGVGSNSEFMAAAQLMKASGTRMVKVPFKGSAQAIPELVAGRIQVYFAPLSAERLAYVKDGRLRLLATVSERRSSFTPEVPTMAEAGYAQVSVPGWNGLVGPPGLRPEVVQKLAREVARALEEKEVRAQMDRLMLEVIGSSPDELRARMRADRQLWAEFVRDHPADL